MIIVQTEVNGVFCRQLEVNSLAEAIAQLLFGETITAWWVKGC